MRTIPRALLLALLTASFAAGCITGSEPTGDDDESPTLQCTQPPANDVDISLLVADATAFADNPVTARFVVGPTVLSCTSATIPSDGNLELFLGGFGPIGGATVELVLSSDADPAHTAGDLTQEFRIGEDGTITPDAPCSVHATWDLAFSTTGAVSEAVTWEVGIGCPGST